LQKAEQASQIDQARDEKAQDQLESAHNKLVRKQVVGMAHTLDHKPLLDYLAGKGCKYINEKSAQGKTALQHAVARNEPDIVQWLLNHGAALEVKDQWDRTPLHRSALHGYTTTTALLLVHGADTETKDKDGLTPLHWAAARGYTATVEFLLARGAVIETKDKDGFTPSHLAALEGRIATVDLLLARGAVIEAKDKDGFTPLHLAALEGRIATVDLLLARGAVIEAKDNSGKTPLGIAIEKGHEAVATVLRAAQAPAWHPRYHVSIAPGAADEVVGVDHPGLFSIYSWKVSCYQKAGHWYANVNYGDKYASHVPIISLLSPYLFLALHWG
jgi:ankyrin repeat protein